MFAGQAPSVGATLSDTITVKLQALDVLFAASFAEQVTVVTPNSKLDPEAGVQVTVGFVVQLSVAVGAVYVAVAVQAPADVSA